MADQSVLDPLLVTRKVIGDVFDMFTPSRTVDISVRYGHRHGYQEVINDCYIEHSLSTNEPTVHISGDPESANLYTLVMTDPDAPSPDKPVLRECLHWMVFNIPEGFDCFDSSMAGDVVRPYIGPYPPSGVHRFVFTLFKQKDTKMLLENTTRYTRHNFSTRTFALENEFGLPVAAVFFNSQMAQPVKKSRITTLASSSKGA